MSETSTAKAKLKPLKITCTSSNCASGLHAFQPKREMKNTDEEGGCRSCGVHLVEWDRIHAFDPDDVDHTFASLRLELIRHHYWHNEMPQRVVNYARRKGWSGLAEAVPARLQAAIGSPADDWDGRQTPVKRRRASHRSTTRSMRRRPAAASAWRCGTESVRIAR